MVGVEGKTKGNQPKQYSMGQLNAIVGAPLVPLPTNNCSLVWDLREKIGSQPRLLGGTCNMEGRPLSWREEFSREALQGGCPLGSLVFLCFLAPWTPRQAETALKKWVPEGEMIKTQKYICNFLSEVLYLILRGASQALCPHFWDTHA